MHPSRRDVGSRADPDAERLRALAALPVTYPEVGASTGTPPAGYRHVRHERLVGVGEAAFRAAAEHLMRWDVHRGAGLTVRASDDRVRPGGVVVLGLGPRPLRLTAPCRVVLVVDEPDRQGFAYGTLPGHPERGEELFLVTRDPAGRVHLRIDAFSRPATWWSHAGGPVTRRVQDVVLRRYLGAAARAAAAAGPGLRRDRGVLTATATPARHGAPDRDGRSGAPAGR